MMTTEEAIRFVRKTLRLTPEEYVAFTAAVEGAQRRALTSHLTAEEVFSQLEKDYQQREEVLVEYGLAQTRLFSVQSLGVMLGRYDEHFRRCQQCLDLHVRIHEMVLSEILKEYEFRVRMVVGVEAQNRLFNEVVLNVVGRVRQQYYQGGSEHGIA